MNHLSKLYNSPLRPFLWESQETRISLKKLTYGATTLFINILIQNSPLWSKYARCIFYITLQTIANFVHSGSTNNCDLTQFECQRTCQIGNFSI